MGDVVIALALAACGPEAGTTSDRELELDCGGMVPFLFAWWKTATLSWDEPSGQLVQRCIAMPSGALTGADAAVVGGAAILDLPSATDQLMFRVAAHGRTFQSVAGSATFSTVEDGKAAGAFDFDANGYDNLTGELDATTTHVRGTFDWCELGVRDDCPAAFEASLQLPFTLSSPGLGEVTGSSSACRMLVDEASGALQIDLAIGVWNGTNVGQLWVSECTDGLGPVVPNAFVFRAPGVTGAGTYGPLRSVTFPGTRLPELRWSHPMTFIPWIDNPTQACAMYWYTALARATDATECTWSVDPGTGGTGSFSVDCTNVDHQSPYSVFTINSVGDFHLEAACTWMESAG